MGRKTEEKSAPHVRLRRRGQELLLTEGSYLLGRDATCHVLLDDPKVSRRHARLNVHLDQVVIEDLGSMNGLYVNGVRLAGSQPLFDGDWITAGAEELELCIGDARRPRTPISTVDEATPIPSSSAKDADRQISEPPEDTDTTQRSRALEILANIADRALDMGRLQDAEDLLKTTLLDVIHEANAGHAIEEDSLDFAVRYSLRLAQSTQKPRWFDYAVDLLRSQRATCSPSTAAALKLTLKELPNADVQRLENYAEALRRDGAPDAKASASRVDELVNEARRKRGR
jgi:pSer/pThr/pTyr-binding forkhead associated (FHA) protein